MADLFLHLLSFTIYLLSFLPLANWLVEIVFALGDIQPFNRGFFCDDQSLMHPYKDDTITTTMLIFVGLAVVVVIVS